ncbi:MAG: hypothetical protein ABJQ14_01115, partial [Hyphomicrobiales bacterium]
DDADDDALAPFSEILSVVAKPTLTKTIVSMEENKQVRNNARGIIIPVREGYGTNELWHTIPYHLQPNNTRNISMICRLELRNKTTEREHTYK